MLSEIKRALGKVKNDYDAELARLALAAVADLGIVCDLHKLVPLLTERLQKELAE